MRDMRVNTWVTRSTRLLIDSVDFVVLSRVLVASAIAVTSDSSAIERWRVRERGGWSPRYVDLTVDARLRGRYLAAYAEAHGGTVWHAMVETVVDTADFSVYYVAAEGQLSWLLELLSSLLVAAVQFRMLPSPALMPVLLRRRRMRHAYDYTLGFAIVARRPASARTPPLVLEPEELLASMPMPATWVTVVEAPVPDEAVRHEYSVVATAITTTMPMYAVAYATPVDPLTPTSMRDAAMSVMRPLIIPYHRCSDECHVYTATVDLELLTLFTATQ